MKWRNWERTSPSTRYIGASPAVRYSRSPVNLTGLLLYVLERKDRFAEEVKVLWKGIWNLSFVLSELSLKFADYVASEVVLLSLQFD